MSAQELAKQIRALENPTAHDILTLKLAVEYHHDAFRSANILRVGEVVTFGKPHGTVRRGVVKRVNEKSIMIDVDGATWRVSPSLVRRIKQEG